MPLVIPQKAQRELVTVARNYYVRADGNDANNGLANTAGGAFLTIQKAVDVIADTLDLSANVTINIGPGTYAGATLRRVVGKGSVTITGDTVTPANVTISHTTTCFNANGTFAYVLTGMKLTNSAGYGVICANAQITIANIEFAACVSGHIYVSAPGLLSVASPGYTITGGASYHILVDPNGTLICDGRTVTITGTPAFPNGFCVCVNGTALIRSNTYSGATTGKRYDVSLNGAINTLSAANPTYFPGSVAGTATTGGQYV